MLKNALAILLISVIVALSGAQAALAQVSGGTLRIYLRENLPNASIHEERTLATLIPFMAIHNNLVMFKQDEPTSSMNSIVPDLAQSWSWDEEQTALTFKLREGVRWHDGQPFTAKDVVCTWDMITAKNGPKFRKNPRKQWYQNLVSVTQNGDYEVTFKLGRPQPALLMLLASGYSPVYPCHVPAATMRSKPIGTGPFKVAEINPNVVIRLVRNADYWKKGRPYLDAIEYKVITNRATAMLAFQADQLDLTLVGEVSIPILQDLRKQVPNAVCKVHPTAISTNLIINHARPPFNNRELVKALMLGIDRAGFNAILYQGEASIGGAMLPPPEGLWGMPQSKLSDVPGYSGSVAENREKARAIMRSLGYGPDNPLRFELFVRNVTLFRDPAVVLQGQLREIWMDAEMELAETPTYVAKMARKDYVISAAMSGGSLDDPDQHFYENYACNSEGNYGQYCDPELDKLFDKQSSETDPEKRKQLVWEIDHKLQLEGVRPTISHYRAATCWQPRVKDLVIMDNSLYNGWRYEDVWLDRQ